MSTITIQVVNFSFQDVPGKTWKRGEVIFKTATGKAESKVIMDFVSPQVWKMLQEASPTAWYDITRVKDKTGKFWNWMEMSRQMVAPVVTGTAVISEDKPAPEAIKRSTYATPEERAMIQVYIIRQSSLSSAVELVKDHGKQPDVDEVLRVAKLFENFVLGTVAEMPDDIVE